MTVMFLNLNKFGITIRNKEQEMHQNLKTYKPFNRIQKILKNLKFEKVVHPKLLIKKLKIKIKEQNNLKSNKKKPKARVKVYIRIFETKQ